MNQLCVETRGICNWRERLPGAADDGYSPVPYQLLHRCAAAVIEAQKFGVPHAAFIVQSFKAPDCSFQAFSQFCHAVNLKVERGQMQVTTVGETRLGIGWVDCPFATDAEVAAVA